MAVAFQSKTNPSWANGTGGSVTLPASTAAGDLLIACLVCYSNTTFSSAPTGWVDICSFTNNANSTRCMKVGYIIATSADVTAGSISYTLSTSQVNTMGLQRWTGHSSSSPISASQALATGGNTDHIITPGITPTADNGFAAFGVCQGQLTWDTCVMTTSDPTFTLDWSVQTALGTDAGTGGWHSGTRAASTATGDVTVHTTASSFGDAGGAIIAIQPPQAAATGHNLTLLGVGT